MINAAGFKYVFCKQREKSAFYWAFRAISHDVYYTRRAEVVVKTGELQVEGGQF